jgi:uncharacterized RDD family membrane protein YckC
MNCPLCGEVCRCPLEPLPSALAQGRAEVESSSGASFITASGPNAVDPGPATDSDPNPVVEPIAASDLAAGAVPQVAEAPAWRDELSDRLNRYRARRKVRPPRYPSLSLKFDAPEASGSANGPSGSSLPEFEPISSHALALDGMRHEPSAAEPEVNPRSARSTETAPVAAHQPVVHASAKIIEFPRFAWGPPPPPPDQLAEPVSERPRILEVPEVAPPAPALGGITIEAAEQQEAERRPGIDIPLQSAPLGLRFVASLVDGLIIVAASALFGYIFWKVTAVRPPLVQILGLAAGLSCFFWAAYQYLMIVYAASTPGLRVAGLELARFDGTSTSRTLRRWRVLAACLSAVSAGMGYAWVFLDEDSLCWHDRITHTYLAPRNRPTKTDRR